jgi:transcriptional regulator with XRE-family HTH domain
MITFNCDVPADVKERMERGENPIRAYREHHHMPFEDLALRAGIAVSKLDAAEHGMIVLDGADLKRVADVLAVPVALLEPAAVAKVLGETDEEAGNGNAKTSPGEDPFEPGMVT